MPFTEFRTDGAMGYYQIYADTDNHCLYFAVSMQDQQVAPGAETAAIALATAAVIAWVAGIIKSRKAKQEEAQEKQRQEEEQEIEEYDE